MFFDNVRDPGIVSSSFGITTRPTASSPFHNAWEQLFVDGALANVSVHIAAGDQGSGAGLTNGAANYVASSSATYALIVGGTSIASRFTAAADPTLSALLALALQNDPATVFQLVAAELRTLPSDLPNITPLDPSSSLTSLFETVWQSLEMVPHAGGLASPFGENFTGAGGVDTTLAVPTYQSAFGLQPTDRFGAGRGRPDVAALSYGDTQYAILNSAYVTDPSQPLLTGSGGTSAASPLWASLTAQFDAVFADQGLPRLGFYNDLLYTAAAITPASFNDILLGSNTTSFYLSLTPTGYFQISTNSSGGTVYTPMVPTGLGVEATPGYDLATGLGSPNGLVLGRTLLAIAHAQTYSNAPAVIDNPTTFSGASGAHLMGGNDALAWTARLAGQAAQGSGFDTDLVTLFDTAGKSIPYQITAQAGDVLGVTAGGVSLRLFQAALTSSFGFVQYGDINRIPGRMSTSCSNGAAGSKPKRPSNRCERTLPAGTRARSEFKLSGHAQRTTASAAS